MNNQYLRHRRMTSEFADACQKKQEQAQEPVAWRWGYRSVTTGEMDWRGYVKKVEHPNLRSPDVIVQPLYTAPRQWQGLTQREIDELWDLHHDDYGNALSATGYERAIEAKLRERNA